MHLLWTTMWKAKAHYRTLW